MDVTTNQFKSEVNRPVALSAWQRIFKIITRRLVGFFRLTEEDRVKAGIYVGDDGYEN